MEPEYKITLTTDQIRTVAQDLLNAANLSSNFNVGLRALDTVSDRIRANLEVIMTWTKDVPAIKENYVLVPIFKALESVHNLESVSQVERALGSVTLPPIPEPLLVQEGFSSLSPK